MIFESLYLVKSVDSTVITTYTQPIDIPQDKCFVLTGGKSLVPWVDVIEIDKVIIYPKSIV